MILQQWLEWLFNSHWHDCSTVTGTIVQQSLAKPFNSRWHDCSVTGTILQQSLARLFNSHWHDCSTVTDTIDQQWLARFFNSHWHNSSTVTGTILQQSGADFFFFLCWQNSSTVKITVEESCHVLGIRHMIRSHHSRQNWDKNSDCLWFICKNKERGEKPEWMFTQGTCYVGRKISHKQNWDHCRYPKRLLQVGPYEDDQDDTGFLWPKGICKPITNDNLEIYRFIRLPFGVM